MHKPATRTAVVMFLCTLLAWVPVAWSQTSPAFDCGKARSTVEKIICGNADLAGKDRLLATLYSQALSDTNEEANAAIRTAQRDWLNRRNACSSAECVSKAYEERVQELITFTGSFDEPYLRALCGSFTSGGDESRLEFQSNDRLIGGDPDLLDVNNDGKPELLYACEGGSMQRACTEYKDAQGNELAIGSMDFSTYPTFGEAHFRYEGRIFIFHSYGDGGRKPAYVSYVTPLNREQVLCDFDNKMATVRISGDAPICLALGRGEHVEEISLPPRTSDNHYMFERFETALKAFGPVDIDNDGKAEDVLELQLSSGAGRGCDWNYFELTTPDGNTLLKTEQSRLVSKLQGMDDEDYYKRNCGKVANRLLRDGGKVYYETNVDNAEWHDHMVHILEGGRVERVCHLGGNVTTTIRSINPVK